MLTVRLPRQIAASIGLMALASISGCVETVQPQQRHQGATSTTLGREVGKSTSDGSPVLPVFMVDVGGSDAAEGGKVPGRLRVIEEHDGTHDNLEGRRAALESRISIEVRGDSTARLPKKSFDIELIDGNGKDLDVPLLGLPADSDWTLHGCGQDQTCLRNALVYALARDFGRYAPRTRFVELFIDDKYQGLYVLVEKVRRGDHRVSLPKPADGEADGDVTGGYIFRMELGQGGPSDPIPRDWVSAVSPMIYSYHYPRYDEITDEQKTHLHDHVAEFETMMQGPDWNHPTRGYRAWLDVPSWVDFTLIQELANNVDGYLKSLYLQKWPQSMGNRIALGPVWDFDNGFAVADFRDGRRTDVWAHGANRFGGHGVPYDPPGMVPNVPAYWERLWTDPAFHRDLQCRWRELREGPLRLTTVNARIDGWVTELSLAQPRDGAVWNNPGKDGYPGEVDYLKEFVDKRLEWMDANLPGTCPRAR